MRTLRKLLLGETWTLPLGVALAVGAGGLTDWLAPGVWHDAGGPALLVAVAGVLVASSGRSR
ncbi:MAG TPA: hypothetical protein VF533_15395 [Solirubrobacteraceae bacterium]|jgi:hypothetical protein